MEYKETLNLPRTDFSMKADLARKEPELIARWKEEKLYDSILAARKNAQPFVLHDGPPYANGHIHYGHILNKILKDIVCKFRTMSNRYVEYKPGWDTHGLPIELAVLRDTPDASKKSQVEIRKLCHDYAMKWVDVQREEFQRLGVFGTWDKPYLTLDPAYEATIVRQLAEFARRGILYKDLKPVHWCVTDRTALAEAEIEYDEHHTSPSIYVKFALPEAKTFAVIWTTTPWTLPANLAIAYHPRFEYVAVRAKGERYIVAADLAEAFVKTCELSEEGPRQNVATDKFVEWKSARHPFLDRESVLLAGDHVTLEQGTGLVHTAPGHGADDYVLGKNNGLAILAPVDDAGRFTDGTWKGDRVFDANPKIVAFLAESGVLVSPPTLKVTHSYPVCWRCKKPVIFRATPQWFAALDDASGVVKSDLRQVALEQIEKTEWIPPWGKNRIRGMIENRPDWVLSRQRVWGVPIPIFYRDGQPIVDPALMDHVASLFDKSGADIWFASTAEQLLPPGYLEKNPGTYTKENDIVDVWFESGVSGAAVCQGRPGLDSSRPDDPRPIDLYLEGSDQHRGWFHSALLTGCATTRRAPYRAVLTHGFVLDERGKPYSKSEIEKARKEGKKIEFIPPENVLKEQGAELLRLWVAQADFRSDVAYSRGHLTQLGESYRKIRNTVRYLLGNLADFDPAQHANTAPSDELDRYLSARIEDFSARVYAAYEAYEFHAVFRSLVDLCTVDLSALYCDVRKDRLYCDAANSPTRRATQAVLYQALRALTTAMAPVLCFTAEEIWKAMPHLKDDPASVHLALLPRGAQTSVALDALLTLRESVQKALEPFRAQKKSSLDARVEVTLPADEAAQVSRFAPEFLADFFIVSRIDINPGAALAVTVFEASGNRCDRCWKWTPDAPVCKRCQTALSVGKVAS